MTKSTWYVSMEGGTKDKFRLEYKTAMVGLTYKLEMA